MDKFKCFERLCIAGTILGLGCLAYLNIIQPYQETQRYNQAYQRALHKFADRNHDGFISSTEEGGFNDKVFPDFRFKYLGEQPQYPDGELVPYDTLESLVVDYEEGMGN